MKPRKKIIPVHFQRKRKPTLSQLLNIASLQKKVREVIARNRYLAKCLEEAHCTIADNNTKLQEYAKNENAYLLLQMKFNTMVETIQNLVSNAKDVKESINMISNISSRNPFEKVTTGISLPPDLETIDESVLSIKERSLLEPESPSNSCTMLSNNASSDKSPLNRKILSKSCAVDFSAPTEVYNVQQEINAFNKQDSMKNLQSPGVINECNSPLTPQLNLQLPETKTNEDKCRTPPTPQLNLIPPYISENKGKTSPSLSMNFSTLQNKPFATQLDKIYNTNLKNNLSETNVSNKTISGIPVYRQILFPGTCNQLHSPLSDNQEDKRKTFVVKESKEFDPDAPSTSLIATKAPEKRKTFAIPDVPFPLQKKKFVQSSNNNQNVSNICPDEGTVHLSEDMDLTEVVSSTVNVMKNISVPSTYSEVSPSKNENKETLNKGFLASEEISPISSIDSKLDYNESSFTEIPPCRKNVTSEETLDSTEKSSFEIVEFSNDPPVRTSSKTCSRNDQHLKTNNHTEKNSVFEKNINIEESPMLSKSCPLQSSTTTTLNTPSKKHIYGQKVSNVIPNVLETASDVSAKLLYKNSDIITTQNQSIKQKTPRRSSLRKKASLSNQTDKAGGQCIEMKELDINEPFLEENENYPLSDDENETKCKPAKIKKKNLKSVETKVNNSATILEQDINSTFQEQSQRKKSLKRKVSFAKNLNDPVNKNNENVIFDENEANEKSSESSNENAVFKPEHNRRKISTRRVSFASTDLFAEDDSKQKINNNTVSYKTRKSELCENVISLPASRRSILKKTEYPVNENVNTISTLSEISEKFNKSTEFTEINEHSDDKALSFRNSDILGGEIIFKNKKTFSGVSERNSKKRYTTDDDFFDTFDINLSDCKTEQEIHSIARKDNKTEQEIQIITKNVTEQEIPLITEKDSKAEQKIQLITEKAVQLTTKEENKTENEMQLILKGENKKEMQLIVKEKNEEKIPLITDKENKTEQEIELITEKKTKSRSTGKKAKLSHQTTPKKSSKSLKKKSKKTINDTESESINKEPLKDHQNEISASSPIKNENIEACGRSRRTRPQISFKEPTLNKKLRRP